MTESMVRHWIEKAEEDLGSAHDNLQAGRLTNAVRDAYFACFHAFSAVLLERGRTCRKYSEVRAALHRDFVRTRLIDPKWGKHYDWLFENRQKADYHPLVGFNREQVLEIEQRSRDFVAEMRRILRL